MRVTLANTFNISKPFQGYIVLYNNTFRPVICESWYFTHMWKARAWPHHFRFGSINLSVYVMPRVIGRHLLLKCLCHAKSDRSSPVIEVYMSCQEWSVVTCYWSAYVMPGEWSVMYRFFSLVLRFSYCTLFWRCAIFLIWSYL